jgi:hypothetical protein
MGQVARRHGFEDTLPHPVVQRLPVGALVLPRVAPDWNPLAGRG